MTCIRTKRINDYVDDALDVRGAGGGRAAPRRLRRVPGARGRSARASARRGGADELLEPPARGVAAARARDPAASRRSTPSAAELARKLAPRRSRALRSLAWLAAAAVADRSRRRSACGIAGGARPRLRRRGASASIAPATRRRRSKPSCGRLKSITTRRSQGSSRSRTPNRARSIRGRPRRCRRTSPVIDQAISESRAAVRRAAGQRAGAGKPARELQDENRAAAGHGGAHQRNAQRQRRGGGADRLRTQTKRRLIMRLRLLVRDRRRWRSARVPAARRSPGRRPRSCVREAVKTVDAARAIRATRNTGPSRPRRFSRKVKVGRDGRVSISNISGDIKVTGGVGRRGVDRSGASARAAIASELGAVADHRRRAAPATSRCEPSTNDRSYRNRNDRRVGRLYGHRAGHGEPSTSNRCPAT